jgi:hypothetical protein
MKRRSARSEAAKSRGKAAPRADGASKPKSQAGARAPLPDLAVLALVLLAALAMHAQAVRVPFFADDYLFLDQVRHASLSTVLTERDPIGNFFRPVGRQVYFWLLSRASGESPIVFHVFNLALFLGLLALLFALARRYAGTLAAAVACGFLAVHYAADVPVRWASGSQDLLAITLALATLSLHTTGRRGWAAAALFLAMLSKETVALTPFVAVVADRSPGTSWRAAFRRAWPMGIAIAAWLALWFVTAPTRGNLASALTLSPLGPLAAVVHLVQVTFGLEWTSGRLIETFKAVPPIPALALVLAALWWSRAPGRRREGDSRMAAAAGPAVAPAWQLGAALAIAGTIPVAAVVSYWSAYFYLYALCGVALLVGVAAMRMRRIDAMLVVALLAWGSAGGRALQEFATGQGLWTIQSHVNRFYFERATLRVSRYLEDMKRQRPTLPARSVLYFAGLPSFVGWQAGDGPLVRWAYRDSSLRSHYMGQITLENSRRGPNFFFIGRNDSLIENTSPEESLRITALAMILDEKLDNAYDALVLHRERSPAVTWSAYWLGWVLWAKGDTARAKEYLAESKIELGRGPAPELQVAQRMAAAGDSLEATQLLISLAGRYGLDPKVHAALSDIALTQRRLINTGQIEALAARVLAPEDPVVWLRWAIVEAQQQRFPQAKRALERFNALGGGTMDQNFFAKQMHERLDAYLPGGERVQEGLRKAGVAGKRKAP